MRPSILETLTSGVAGASDKNILHDQYKTEATLNATSTPAISQVSSFLATLSGGALSVDLTALTGAGGAALDLSGLKVQGLYLEVSAGDSPMTFVTGASNGYDFGGLATWSVTLTAGESAMFFWNETSDDVSGTDKIMDISGTGTDTCEICIIAG